MKISEGEKNVQKSKVVVVIEKLIKKIANSQAFMPDDKLGRMIKEYETDELAEESLDLVYAARKNDADYADFLRLAHERDSKHV